MISISLVVFLAPVAAMLPAYVSNVSLAGGMEGSPCLELDCPAIEPELNPS